MLCIIAELVPRIEDAIECYEHRSWGDDTESPTVADLAEEYRLASNLFEVTKGVRTAMHIGVEHIVKGPLWAWLCDPPVELSSASMHEEALDLAESLHSLLGTDRNSLRVPINWRPLRLYCSKRRNS